MAEYNILGLSPATVAMLLEAIYCATDTPPVDVTIYQNREPGDLIEFDVPGVPYTVWGHKASLPKSIKDAILGVYQPRTKEVVAQYFNESVDSVTYRSVVHPSAVLASTASIAEGSFVNANVTFAPYSVTAKHVTVNRNASIGHHTSLGRFCTINPGAHIAGHCRLGQGVTIGMGACVADGITIGENSIIGAGSVVVRDIPSGVKAFGTPCKVISEL